MREVERSEMPDHQEKRNQESKVTDPINDECFLAGRCRRVFCEPEADQQIRRQPHALPAERNNAMKKAAPQKTSATADIAFFDDRRPKKPLIAAPARGRIGMTHK